MFGTRPAPTVRYLERPRILDRLPDSGGYVVWFEAPYGSGKSVLANQWCARLEAVGWRVLWFALAGRQPLDAVRRALGLDDGAPWGVVLEALWRTPTVLVLEDLDGSEAVEPLLKDVGGLILLASRGPLPWSALVPLQTSGRLVHLTADTLAFTEHEAVALGSEGDEAAQRRRWGATGGWALPLHFATLTGATPDREALLDGIRASVGAAAWHEALLVATLDVLPRDAATPETHDLVASGFVQSLEAGFRLHPLVAEIALETRPEEVRAAVVELAPRLSGALRGRAYEHVGHTEGLRSVLEDPRDETFRFDCESYLRWHGRTPGPAGPVRRTNVSVALVNHGSIDEGVRAAAEVVFDEAVDAKLRTRAALVALHVLGERGAFDEANPFRDVAERMAPLLPPLEASSVTHMLMPFAYRQGDYESMERYLDATREALARAVDDPRHPEAVAIFCGNVHTIRWRVHGEFRAQSHEMRAILDRERDRAPAARTVSDFTLARLAVELAVIQASVGDLDEARTVVAQWRPRATGAAAVTLGVLGAALGVEGGAGIEAFPTLLAEARRWERPDLVDGVGAAWLRTLRAMGDFATAESLRDRLEVGPATRVEYAILDGAMGRREAAERTLTELEAFVGDRTFRICWHEASFLVRGRLQDLDAICAASEAGPAVLANLLIPLASLPRDRPELARAYPLAEVMASGWTEAALSREPEVPPMQLTLLGGVSARVLGRDVALTDRQKQLLTLMYLRRSREEIGAALWPHMDATQVRNNLNVLASGLRRALQPWGAPTFLVDGTLVRTECDVDRLEVALAAGDAAAVAALYRGRFALDVDLGSVAELGVHLERRVVDAIVAGAVGAADGVAIDLLERALAIDPVHEVAMHRLLAALIAVGRMSEARRRMRAFTAVLHDEFGAQPAAPTRRLFH